MKTILKIIVIFSFLTTTSLVSAEIYKWVDEKGTVHFTEGPATIPERHKDKAERKVMEGSPQVIGDKIKVKKKQEPGNQKTKQELQDEFPSSAKSYDPNDDPDYREMTKTLQKSAYYQRDVYYRGSGRIMHQSGDFNQSGAATAETLKRELDELVRNPEYAVNSEYKRKVKQYFDNHFYDKDEYYRGSQQIMHFRGEIKSISQVESYDNGEKDEVKAGVINPQTGEFYPRSGSSGYINPRTGEFYPKSGDGAINPRTGEYYP